jgi:hypothetical protein
MTADELATLAKVERLLADQQADDYANGDPKSWRLVAAQTLLRGLLAEPQVNPGEAKATENIAETLEQMYVIRQHAEPEPVGMVDLVRVVVHEARRTGLLAEGEESRAAHPDAWPEMPPETRHA